MSDGAEELLAAYLEQRRVLGEPALMPDSMSRADFMTLIEKAAENRVSGAVTTGAVAAGAVATGGLGPGRSPSGSSGTGAAPPEPLTSTPSNAPRRTQSKASDSPRASDRTLPTVATAGTDYDTLHSLAMGCVSCPLSESRNKVVFSDGNPKARLMVVGEAPGANEDETGVPFVGMAGKLLDLMLASVDLSRQDSVYIANVLKCRPPGNRNPQPEEIEACSGFLKRQIELVSPDVLLTVGSFSAQLLTRTQTALGKLRGTVHTYHDVPLVVTYHPAALLRNPGWSRPAWDDLQLLRQVMDKA